MPPKAPKKEREKAERRAAEQLLERQELELDEEKARQLVEMSERQERSDHVIYHLQALTNPAARLMVLRSSYD